MANRYREFFNDSIEGQAFVANLQLLIQQQHDKAENDPDHARDYTQQAKGIRLALNQINTYTANIGPQEAVQGA